ncbi:hypothetical protein ADL35_02135 [Streptomyces sp. NRRL WC-3753]|nr:hypothetical protein ADL35_02135 [Streptomyces sp. NRRL WC-3753]
MVAEAAGSATTGAGEAEPDASTPNPSAVGPVRPSLPPEPPEPPDGEPGQTNPAISAATDTAPTTAATATVRPGRRATALRPAPWRGPPPPVTEGMSRSPTGGSSRVSSYAFSQP